MREVSGLFEKGIKYLKYFRSIIQEQIGLHHFLGAVLPLFAPKMRHHVGLSKDGEVRAFIAVLCKRNGKERGEKET